MHVDTADALSHTLLYAVHDTPVGHKADAVFSSLSQDPIARSHWIPAPAKDDKLQSVN